MSKKKIYIAGKVTGLPQDEVTAKFAAAKKKIESLGFEAVNPLEVVNNWNITWREAMVKCIKALVDCDGVIYLDNHRQSVGATIERRLAHDLEIQSFYSFEALNVHQWSN